VQLFKINIGKSLKVHIELYFLAFFEAVWQ